MNDYINKEEFIKVWCSATENPGDCDIAAATADLVNRAYQAGVKDGREKRLTGIDMQEIYDKALEEWPQAGKEITKPQADMREAFDKYLDAIQEDAFRYGYQCALADEK